MCIWLAHLCNPYIHLYGMAEGYTGLKFLWDGNIGNTCYSELFFLKDQFSLYSSLPTGTFHL